MCSAILLAGSLLAVVLVLALAREVRLRRALQRLLAMLLNYVRRGNDKNTRGSRRNTLIVIPLTGCGETPDARLHDLARESLAQQARQNGQIARQAQQIAESVHRLVQADSQARQELLAAHAKLQQDLQTERVSIERQLTELEQERRQLAQQRARDPIVANSILAIGSAIACLLPLLLAGYVLFTVNRPDDKEAALNQMLVTEFVAEQPCLLPSPADVPRRLEHRPSASRRPRLPKPASL